LAAERAAIETEGPLYNRRPGKPFGPPKRRITVTILETSCQFFEQEAELRGLALPTMLAEVVEREVFPDLVKVPPRGSRINGKSHPVMPAEVEPRFKKAPK
jgi:hypothetical protein